MKEDIKKEEIKAPEEVKVQGLKDTITSIMFNKDQRRGKRYV